MREPGKIGRGIIAFASRTGLVALSLAFGLATCGKLFDCYDATLVGTNTYYLMVAEKSAGKKREIHSTADQWTMARIAAWKSGDELAVCNDIVTNKTRNESAECGDFGCLSIWP
jgi:hypothetical protein